MINTCQIININLCSLLFHYKHTHKNENLDPNPLTIINNSRC